ncbi:MAG: ABC transporter ATP-binding protein [Rickettsiaceae bacterium]|nr:ABC transporter ATP-binding protein [Rickettsiaceae bacterium]
MDKYTSTYVFKRLVLNYIYPHRYKIFVAIFFMILVALSYTAIVKLVAPAIDKVLISQDKDMMVLLPLAILGLSIFKGGADFYQYYIIKSVGQRILCDMQIILYEHLLKSDIAFITSQSSARLISRFTNDIALMRNAVSHLLVGFAKHLLTVSFLIILMFNLQPSLTCLIFIVFPLAIYPIQQNGRRMRALSNEAQNEMGNYTVKLDEAFSSIKIVKSYMAENFESDRAKNIVEQIYKIYKKTMKYDALTGPIMETLSGIAIATIIIYGGYMVSSGNATPGTIFAFVTAFVSAYRPFKSLVSLNLNFQETITSATRVFKVLDQEPLIENKNTGIDIDFSNSDIEFRNVSLNFGSKKVLHDINLKIAANSKIAIVGRSGEGKTSIANLLLRFYEASSGDIYINNIKIQDINLKSLRSQTSIVTQDTYLFEGTIASNISYSSAIYSMEEIIDAAKAASAHDFIMSLKDGYDTVIDHTGSILSGGQKQRIAIARAFLKNAPILILDEATSGLDPETEKQVKDSIYNLCKNRTTIIITHRLHTIENTDHIYVIKNGKIVENGTHKSLINGNGEYESLTKKLKSSGKK